MEIILPDTLIAGIFNSQIALSGKTITEYRTTTLFEIELPIEKGGTTYINSAELPIETDTIICAKPGQRRRSKLPLKCYYIHMAVGNGMLYDSLIKLPDSIKISEYTPYYERFKKICGYYDTDCEEDKIIQQSLVLEIVYMLIKDSKRTFSPDFGNSRYQAVESAKTYIKENLSADLSLENVSEYAGFSPIHFHNMFKTISGKTLREYVEEQRIKKAMDMLVTTDYTLTEIAYECGFSSQSYFSYVFKRKMKSTPREYVKAVFDRYKV